MAYKQQTAVQESNAIRFGSAKFEIGADIGSLVDVGAIRSGVWEETFDKVSVPSDNAGPVDLGIRNHLCSMSGDLMEINLDIMEKFFSGVHTVTSAGASPVSITDEECTLNDTTQVVLAYRNADGTEVDSITVTEADDSATTRDTDYSISVNASGYTTITRITTGAFGDGDVAKVDYDYTPASARTLVSGGAQTFEAQVARFTNYDVDGNEFRITIWEATPDGGISINFQSDDAEDPAMVPIKIIGRLDVSKTSGEQLFEIKDEQHVT